MHGTHPMALQQWIDARTRLSGAIQAFVSATIHLQSTCTPFAIKSSPTLMATIENNLETLVHDELASHRAQAALKKKRNSYISFINLLPSELLAYIFKFTVAPNPPHDSSNGYGERKLSQVCSRWRQIALQVCPAWLQVSLTSENYNTSKNRQRWAQIGLHDARARQIVLHVDHQPGVGDTSYIQTTLDTIAPYISQLCNIQLAADNVEHIRPFLDFWLEKGTPGSLDEFSLSLADPSLVFPETNSRSSDCLSQFLRHAEELTLRSVGLNWSSVAFDRLAAMVLSDLPAFCCPSLAQLAHILSACPVLQNLQLKNIVIPTSLDSVALEPVALEYLEYLALEELDVQGVLSVICPGHSRLILRLQGAISDTETLASLRSFAGRANIQNLTLSLSEPRSDEALALLLLSSISPLLDLECVTLEGMKLRESELGALASHPFTQNYDLLPSAPVTSIGGSPETNRLRLQYCTIYTTAQMFHSAISVLPWPRVSLRTCNHFLATQGEADGPTEIIGRITAVSDFGMRLKELIPDRVDFQ